MSCRGSAQRPAALSGVALSELAEADPTNIWVFVAQDNAEAADSLLDQLHEKCQFLAATPRAGRQRCELHDKRSRSCRPRSSGSKGSVLVTPHVSGNTDVGQHRGVELFCNNLRVYLDGRPLINIIRLVGWLLKYSTARKAGLSRREIRQIGGTVHTRRAQLKKPRLGRRLSRHDSAGAMMALRARADAASEL